MIKTLKSDVLEFSNFVNFFPSRDMDIVIKLFDNLEGKICQAHQYELDSLL